MRELNARDLNAMRAEFWQLKRVQALQTDMQDAKRRGDPLAYYRLRDELASIRTNSPFLGR